MQSSDQTKAPSDESALINIQLRIYLTITPASPAENESPPRRSPSCRPQVLLRAPAHASAPAHFPASYAPATWPPRPRSTASLASRLPSAPENVLPADPGPPSAPAAPAPPREIQPADDKDLIETSSPHRHSRPAVREAGESLQSREHPRASSRCRPLAAVRRTPETAASSPATPSASRQSHPETAFPHAPPQCVPYATAPPR